MAPVAVGAPAKASKEVEVKVTSLKQVTTKATIPGDITGPAVQVDVTITNGGTTPLPLDQVTVNLTGTGDIPGVLQQGAPTKAFTGALAAGRSASGTYAFRIGKDHSAQVRVDISASPQVAVTTVNGRPA